MTSKAKDEGPAPMQTSRTDDHILLIGHPPITDYFQYVRTKIAQGKTVDRGALATEWRAANAVVRELESSEAGMADDPVLTPLSTESERFAEQQIRDDAAQRILCLTPYQWAIVELDRVVVYQKTINLSYASQIADTLGRTVDEKDLMRIAVGGAAHRPALQIRQPSDGTYTFSCRSNDLRLLSTGILDLQSMQECPATGRPVTALGLFIGFGLNIINVLHVGNRLFLINGSHRAFALRKRGITHVPCLVQRIVQDEDLDVLGVGESRQKIERYLKIKRPPLFKDYFDERLTKQFAVPRNHVMLQVQLTSQYISVPEV